MIVGAFGPMVFLVSADMVRTFRSGSRDRATRFAVHEPIGGVPRLEASTPDLDQVKLEIVLDQNQGNSPAIELAALNKMMELQETWPLILGPIPFGEYVLTGISEQWRRWTGTGALASVAVSLSLLQNAEGPLARKIANGLG